MVRIVKTRPYVSLGLAALSIALVLVTVWVRQVFADHDIARIRWDLASVNFLADPVSLNPGGINSALAIDGSKITLTGGGTFVVGSTFRAPWAVDGGGTWTTFGPDGVTQTGRGTYRVLSLVHWQVAPGEAGPDVVDNMGRLENRSAGLAVFRIGYSDHTEGHLVVSCRLNFVRSPETIHEGITVSKGFVNYYDNQGPVAGVDENRTLFHFL